MTPELLALIQTVLLEAIKILGPAAIAAYATYRATSIQFEIKLKELERTHEFTARDRVYSHLKERLAKVEQDSARMNGDIGRMLGFVTGAKGGEEVDGSLAEFVKIMGAFADSTARRLPLEVGALLDDMRRAGLADSAEFNALKEYENADMGGGGKRSFDDLKATLLRLLEINDTMGLCMQRLISQQMKTAFTGYVKS